MHQDALTASVEVVVAAAVAVVDVTRGHRAMAAVENAEKCFLVDSGDGSVGCVGIGGVLAAVVITVMAVVEVNKLKRGEIYE